MTAQRRRTSGNQVLFCSPVTALKQQMSEEVKKKRERLWKEKFFEFWEGTEFDTACHLIEIF